MDSMETDLQQQQQEKPNEQQNDEHTQEDAVSHKEEAVEATSEESYELVENMTDDDPVEYRSFNELTTEPTPATVKPALTSPSLPAMFSSSFSTFKSFAKRSLSSDLERSSVASEISANEDGESQSKVEKRNLLGMAKLSIKGLIESSLSAGHILDSDHVPLQQFFVIIEYIMRQGLKAPKNFFIQNKYFWPVLENVEKFSSDAAEITDSARNLPGIRTYLGRGRAWLRLALMKKKLADYMKVIVDNKSCFSEWYETDALLMCEEGTVLIGHLVGLNCIDANLCMKGDDLDNQVTVIDYSQYMKRNNVPTLNLNNEEGGDGGNEEKKPKEENEVNTVQKLTDQKNYLEERNRYLETTTSELLKRSETLEISNTQLEAELKATKIQLNTLQSDRERILSEKENLTLSHMKTLEDREKDLDLERETLRNSKSELDDMFQQIQKQLRHETNMRMDVEKELELQMSLKQELEMSMKLLEKDVYEKQDGVVTLREQLDNVKAINQDIYQKLQEKTSLEQEKSKSIIKLEGETQKLATKVVKMQQQLAEAERQVNYARERVEQLTFELDDSEKQRTAQTTNLQIEREWREALQEQIVNHEEEKLKLREQVNKLQIVESELFDIQQDRDRLRETNMEQEITIQDLAGHLGQSKQEIGEIKETVKSVVGTKWEQDKAVTECVQCTKSFNISRRKHHCRNCGQIFCNSCSDNVMPLASSAKPVRVCDNCHNTLLQRFSANTNT